MLLHEVRLSFFIVKGVSCICVFPGLPTQSPFTFLPPPPPALETGERARAATLSFIRFLDDGQLQCLPFGAVCYESGSRCSCIGLNLGTDILSLERVCEWHCCVMRQTHAKL